MSEAYKKPNSATSPPVTLGVDMATGTDREVSWTVMTPVDWDHDVILTGRSPKPVYVMGHREIEAKYGDGDGGEA